MYLKGVENKVVLMFPEIVGGEKKVRAGSCSSSGRYYAMLTGRSLRCSALSLVLLRGSGQQEVWYESCTLVTFLEE